MNESQQIIKVPVAWFIRLHELVKKAQQSPVDDPSNLHMLYGYLESIEVIINNPPE